MSILSDALRFNIRAGNFNNFPSGLGSWNCDSNYRENANLYTNEQLMDLLTDKYSPWCQYCDLSDETVEIKQKILERKQKIGLDSVQMLFKTLRLPNNNIIKIDESTRKLLNLAVLILSSNFIESIDAGCLPKNLKVLELYANKIQDISFCSKPNMSPLEHLGLGRNLLSNIDGIVPVVPGISRQSILLQSLVSLDLGNNQLTQLEAVVDILMDFQLLKNLNLSGNPLSFICVYRGYVIDSLKQLTIFDDVVINADERYSVKSMRQKSDQLKNKCCLTLTIDSVKNLPELPKPEDTGEEPIIKVEYYLKYWTPFCKEPVKSSDDQAKPAAAEEDHGEAYFMYRSPGISKTATDLIFNWSEDINVTNLQIFSDSLDSNLNIELIEESKYFYSPDNLPVESSRQSRMPSSRNSKHQKTTGGNKPAAKKETAPPAGGGKKKKADESKLVLHKVVPYRLANFQLDLSQLKSGAVKFSSVLDCDGCFIHDSKKKEDKNAKLKKPTKPPAVIKEERTKTPDRTKHGKRSKTPASNATNEDEAAKHIECSVEASLLNITSTKSLKSL